MLNTNKMPWETTEHPGVSRKVLERVIDPKKGRETALLKFEPNASAADRDARRRGWTSSSSTAPTRTGTASTASTRSSATRAGYTHTPSSKTGCVLYVKWRVPIRPKQPDERHGDRREDHAVDAVPAPRRGRAAPLPRHARHRDRRGSAFVHPHKKIPSHDHAIGEETLDRQGLPQGRVHRLHRRACWFRMPSACRTRRTPRTTAA